MKAKLQPIEFLDRETVERIAHIVGDSSAAADCLRKSQDYENPVFWQAGPYICVADRDFLERIAELESHGRKG